MKPEATGSGHLCLFLLASLAVHLGIACAITGGRDGAGGREQPPAALTVQYLDLSVLKLPRAAGGGAAGDAAVKLTANQMGGAAGATAGRSFPPAHPVALPPAEEAPPAQGVIPKGVHETVRRATADPAAGTGGSPLAARPAAPDPGVTTKVGSGSRPSTGSTQGTAAAASRERSVEGAPGPASSGSIGQLRLSYQQQLKSLIESHKKYPLAARRSRQEGSCVRRFSLGRDGALRSVESVTSCGHPFLDEAATSAIASVGRFPPLPGEFGVEESFSVTITFALAGK